MFGQQWQWLLGLLFLDAEPSSQLCLLTLVPGEFKRAATSLSLLCAGGEGEGVTGMGPALFSQGRGGQEGDHGCHPHGGMISLLL